MKTAIETTRGYKFESEINFVDGTDNQQNYALNILTNKLTSAIQYFEQINKTEAGKIYLDVMVKQTSAMFWINNKNEDWKVIVKSIM